MEQNAIKAVFDSLLGEFDRKKIELYERVVGDSIKDTDIQDIEDFHYKIIYPFENFIEGLLKKELNANYDLVFIYSNSQFLERSFQRIITDTEGSACCADKSRTIIKRLSLFYQNGTKIEFNYNAEYTFHLPKKVFKTHD